MAMATAPDVVEATARPGETHDVPFRIGGPTRASWREHALARIAEQRFLAIWFRAHTDEPDPAIADATVKIVHRHLDEAEAAAEGRHRRRTTRVAASMGGADVERAMSHLDAATATLLRIAPRSYVRGQLASVVIAARSHLAADDLRRGQVESLLARPPDTPFSDHEREAVIATVHGARSAARREIMRVRSFRTLLLLTALLLTFAAAAVVALGVARPDVIALCFNPGDAVVCPTHQDPLTGGGAPAGSTGTGASSDARAGPAGTVAADRLMRQTASPWDVPLIALVGLMAAALAAAAAVRGVWGTSTPYSLPVALALLKLPMGALTAVLGILLMRGQFVPGLSALDSPEQIVAWAIVFGYSQQLLTRFVDQRAQNVLGSVRAPGRSHVAGAGTGPQAGASTPAAQASFR